MNLDKLNRFRNLLIGIWVGIIVVIFAVSAVTNNTVILKMAVPAIMSLPILFATFRSVQYGFDRKARLAKRWDHWDAQHPNTSEEFKEAMRSLRP